MERNWEIPLRLMEFCVEYQQKRNSIYTIIMILHIPIRLDTRKIQRFPI